LPFSGPNGSTTYTDLTGRAVSYLGGSIVTSDFPPISTDSSVYDNTSTVGICSYAASTDWDISTGDFTIDGWLKVPTGITARQGVLSRRSVGSAGWEWSLSSSGTLDFIAF